MNPHKFVLDMMDLLKRHEMLAENGSPQYITITLEAPFQVIVNVEYK